MLETILKLYSTYMATGVTSPVPHYVGPPGCGKSTSVEEAAKLIGCQLHVINVARLSPLEMEGLQMPVENNTRVHMIPAAYWSRLHEGDIVLLDEFLRGFPEVYNGFLDIITSRRAGEFQLPRVFFIAASNTITTYDVALEDRLLHLPVPDPRKRKSGKKDLGQRIVDALGLLPDMATSMEMTSLLDTEVLPMYEVLDHLKNKSTSPATLKGSSIRKLIGQAQLRQVESTSLKELLSMNNRRAMQAGKPQYVFFTTGKDAQSEPTYEAKARQLKDNPRLSPIQAMNLELNLQLIEMEQIRHEKGTNHDDDDDILDEIFS